MRYRQGFVALFGMVLLGCAEDPSLELETEEEVASGSAALNSHLSFGDGCTGLQKERLERAAEIALRQVNGSDRGLMLTCLKEASLSMSGAYPEQILAALREDMSTIVACEQARDGVNAHAGVGIPFEMIAIDYDFLNEACNIAGCAAGVSDVERIASVFLHEVAHNKGFSHPENEGGTQEYRYTVPEQVEQCSLAISSGQLSQFPRGTVPHPNGAMRSAAQGRVELQFVGENGGTAFGIDTCGDGRFASGLHVRTGRKVDNVSLRCDSQTGNGAVSLTAERGGSGGTTAALDCGSGRLMVGVHGRAGDELDAIAPVCARASDLASNRTPTTDLEEQGGDGGQAFRRVCPVGKAVKALAGRAGERVDQLSLICQDWDLEFTPSVTWLAVVGDREGRVYQHRCPSGAMMSVFGQSGGKVDRVGGECEQLGRNSGGGLQRTGSRYAFSAHGGDGGTNWSADRCPSDQAIVGFKFRAGSKIDSIQGVCADVGDWAALRASAAQSVLDVHGGSGGSPESVKCPLGKFVMGWEISAADGVVSSIRPMCSDFF